MARSAGFAAFPYGLQHVLAMFVANLAPIAIIAAAAGLPGTCGPLIQNAMFIAGIGTFDAAVPLARVGSGLPIVMGISFTFRLRGLHHRGDPGLQGARGAVIVGGLIEGVLGCSPAGGGVSSRPSWRLWW